MRRTTVLSAALAVAALLVAAPGFAGDDEDAEVRWFHDWVPTRLFTYKHKVWRSKESSFKTLYTKDELTIRQRADGSESRRWEFELQVRDPAYIPNSFHVASINSLTDTKFTTFELSWTSGGVTKIISEDDLLQVSYDAGTSYIRDSAGMYARLDGSKPGVLRGVIETLDGPHPGFEGLRVGMELLQRPAPVASRTITLEVPHGTPIAFETRFFELPESLRPETEGDVDRYTVTVDGLLFLNGEPGMPHVLDSFPSLWWSNQPSWEALSAMMDAAWEPQLIGNRAMDAWAKELTAGAQGTVAKALAIHDAIADGWDYLGFYPGQSGWTPHAATECYSARLGDCKDKTALMITLMRSVGLDAHPVAVNAGDAYQLPSVPLPYFNHAIVWVADPKLPDRGFFLDSTDAGIGAFPVGGAWLGDRDALVIDESAGGVRHIPAAGPERWLEEDLIDIALRPDGSGTVQVALRSVGMAANRAAASVSWMQPAARDRAMRRRLLYAFPGATIDALEYGPDPDAPHDVWSVRATLSVASVVSMQGAHAVFSPPWVTHRPASVVSVDGGTRIHPEVLPPLNHRGRIRLTLPDGMTVLALPEPGGEERDDWRSEFTSAHDGNEVTLALVVQEHPGPMDNGLQEARRNFVDAVSHLQRRPLVLEVKP